MDVFEFFSTCPGPPPSNNELLTRPKVMSEGFNEDTWTLKPEAITNVVKVRALKYHRHPSRIDLCDMPKYTWITQITYIPAIVLTKVAILLFFIGLLGRTWACPACFSAWPKRRPWCQR